MTDGWRNRLIAPVYAFVISFGFVVILGAALDDPTRIQFEIPEQPELSELPEEFKDLKDFKVRVDTGPDTKELGNKPPGRSSEFTLSIPDIHIRICSTLPKGWVVENVVAEPDREFCRERNKRGEDIKITLKRQGANP